MEASLAGRRGRRLALAALCVACLAGLIVLALAEPSWAASRVGKRVGSEIETWGKALLLGVVALVGIPAIAKRDVAGGAVVAGLAVLIGGFVFAPGAVKSVISGLWRAIGG